VLSRISALAARPRHTLGALAVVLAAVGVAVGSGANFTAHVASAGNTFSAGTLSIGGGGSAVLHADNMKPGDVRTGTADIQNTGSVSGDFTLSSSNPTGFAPLLAQLDLVVQDCGTFASGTPTCDAGDPPVYTGKVDGLLNVTLGAWAAGEKHRYLFTTTFPNGTPATDNPFQGKSATLDFDWTATS